MERAVILVSSEQSGVTKFLLLRPATASFYNFPIIKPRKPHTFKTVTRKTLAYYLQLNIDHLEKVGATVYQSPERGIVIFTVFKGSVAHVPVYSDVTLEVLWLSKREIINRMAQMSNAMQDYIIPQLDREELW